MGEHGDINIGCWKILEEYISKEDICEAVDRHGTFWNVQKLVSVLLSDFGFKIREHGPQPGDLIISGNHLGKVSEDGNYVLSIMRGRRIKTKINKIKAEYILWR